MANDWVVWKYTLQLAEVQLIIVPQGSRVLTVQMQHGEPRLWVLVDPQAPKAKRYVGMIGTGQPVDPAILHWSYLGTVQSDEGALVAHVLVSKESIAFPIEEAAK